MEQSIVFPDCLWFGKMMKSIQDMYGLDLENLQITCNRRESCGLDDCLLTQLLKKKDGGFTITSTCPYHYAQMQYRSVSQFSIPCTNIPIYCPVYSSSFFQPTNNLEI